MTSRELESPSTSELAIVNAPREYHDIDRMIWTLLVGIIAPPLLALLDQQVNHSLAEWACTSGRPALLHLASLFLLGLVVLSGIGAARCLKEIWLARAVASRPGLMAMAGVFESAAFTTVIVVQWLPSQLLLSCQ